MGLGNYIFLVTSRNNCFDAQTDISQRDKVLHVFFLWLVVFSQKTVSGRF